jgi:Restriction alleviation protein Lar
LAKRKFVMTDHKPDLLPCPFCGSPAELELDSDHHGEWFNLGCSNHWEKVREPAKPCVGGRLFYTEPLEERDAAISAWNSRAPVNRAEWARKIEGVLNIPSSGHASAGELADTILDALGVEEDCD